MMNTDFFDTNHVRRNETLRRNKNHDSVMPLKTLSFVIDDKPVDHLTGKPYVRPFKIIFVSLFQIPESFQKSRF